MPDTTPLPDGGETTPQDNWEQRYLGLQKVLAKRDADLAARDADLATLRSEHEQATARLSEYDQKAVDASEEETARQTYEALRERFEQAPPTPIGNNPARPAKGWEEGSDSPWGGRGRTGTGMGFPT